MPGVNVIDPFYGPETRIEPVDPMLAMDFETVDAQLAEPRVKGPMTARDRWLARRAFGFGASDIPALLVGLGMREMSSVPKGIQKHAKVIRGTKGAPRIVAEKAGLKAALAHSGGGELEGELVYSWRDSLAHDHDLDPASIIHEKRPYELQAPLVDPLCPRLMVSLDAWGHHVLGMLETIEGKCGDPNQETEAWPKDGSCPWWWRTQVQAQLAATGAWRGWLVCGVGWSFRGGGPISAWPIERDEDAIAEIRSAVVKGWSMVEELRAA
jgi:hypothetical protein